MSEDTVALGDLCSVITKGTTPTTAGGGFTQSGISFVKSESLSYEGSIDESKFAFIDEATHDLQKRSQIADKDILYSIAGANLGKCGVATARMLPANTNQAVAIIRVDPARALPEFVAYFLRGKKFVSSVLGSVAQSAQPNVNLGDIGRFRIPKKPMEEQESIAEILSSLDEKIELNRKQNRTLEAIAQALFKRWFVEFEFPDENGRPYQSSGGAMQPSELGEIPVGWEAGCIGDFVEHKKDGVNPGDQPDEQFFHFSIPNFDDGQAAKPELGGTILSNKYLVAPDSILVSKLNPRFPRIWPVFGVPGERSVCSTEFQVLSPVEGAFGFVLRLLKSPLVASEMVSRASGTSGSHQRINPDDLLSIEVIKPAEDVIECFHLAVLDGIRKAQANLEQNRVLGEVRDTLLPKLMSGELRVA